MTETSDPTAIELLTDDELEPAGQAASAELDDMRAAHEKLAADHATKAASFEQDPSEKSFVSQEVAKQKVKKAKAALETKEQEFAPLFAELSRRAQRRRLDELRKLMRFRPEVDASAARVSEIVLRFEAELNKELGALSEHLVEVTRHVNEANGLEQSFAGDFRGVHARPKATDIVMALREEFERRIGQSGVFGTRSAQLTFPNGGGRNMAEFHLHFPSPLSHEVY